MLMGIKNKINKWYFPWLFFGWEFIEIMGCNKVRKGYVVCFKRNAFDGLKKTQAYFQEGRRALRQKTVIKTFSIT